MTTLSEQLEAMRVRMNDIASQDQRAARDLGSTMKIVDDRMLEQVQCITAQHCARRGAISLELQALNASLGTLPIPQIEHDADAARTSGTSLPIGAPMREIFAAASRAL